MKAFLHQAPVVGYTFPSPQKSCVFLRSGCTFSHLHQLIASKDSNRKHTRLTVTRGSLSSPESGWEDSSPKNIIIRDDWRKVSTEYMDPRFIESIVFDKCLYKYEILDRKNCTVEIMKQQGLRFAGEILCALDKIEQDILQGKFEWKDGQDVHTNIMEALVNLVGEQAKELTTSNKSDRCLFVLKTWCMDCVDSIATRMKQIEVALMSLAVRNRGLVLTGNQNTEDNASIESIILPIVQELRIADDSLHFFHYKSAATIRSGCSYALGGSYSDRFNIEYIWGEFNYGVPRILMHMVEKFDSWRNHPFFMPNDEVVTYDTFIEKFRPKRRTVYGYFALCNSLNTFTYSNVDYFDIEDAKFYLYSGVENVLEMLDWCAKFAEGVAFKESSPPRGYCDAISLAGFLRSKGLSLEASYGVVCRCLYRQVQPGELTPQELRTIGCPCDSLEEIRSLLLGKEIAFDGLANWDSFAELLIDCGELELDPRSFC